MPAGSYPPLPAPVNRPCSPVAGRLASTTPTGTGPRGAISQSSCKPSPGSCSPRVPATRQRLVDASGAAHRVGTTRRPGASRPSCHGSARREGLGLYVCRQLLGLAGGSVWVAEHAGPGTDIRVCLPRYPVDEREAPEPSRSRWAQWLSLQRVSLNCNGGKRSRFLPRCNRPIILSYARGSERTARNTEGRAT